MDKEKMTELLGGLDKEDLIELSVELVGAFERIREDQRTVDRELTKDVGPILDKVDGIETDEFEDFKDQEEGPGGK